CCKYFTLLQEHSEKALKTNGWELVSGRRKEGCPPKWPNFTKMSHLVVKPTYRSLLKLEKTIPLTVNKKRAVLGCVHTLGTVSVQGPGSEG
ncbi:hypothetical protein LEMLEM_LOCUS18939, partial [Lemmus lemmus]